MKHVLLEKFFVRTVNVWYVCEHIFFVSCVLSLKTRQLKERFIRIIGQFALFVSFHSTIQYIASIKKFREKKSRQNLLKTWKFSIKRIDNSSLFFLLFGKPNALRTSFCIKQCICVRARASIPMYVCMKHVLVCSFVSLYVCGCGTSMRHTYQFGTDSIVILFNLCLYPLDVRACVRIHQFASLQAYTTTYNAGYAVLYTVSVCLKIHACVSAGMSLCVYTHENRFQYIHFCV